MRYTILEGYCKIFYSPESAEYIPHEDYLSFQPNYIEYIDPRVHMFIVICSVDERNIPANHN